MWPSGVNANVSLIKHLHPRHLVHNLNNWLFGQLDRSENFCWQFCPCASFCFNSSVPSTILLAETLKHAFASTFSSLHSCFCSKWLGFKHRSRYESRRPYRKRDFFQWSQQNLTDRKVYSRCWISCAVSDLWIYNEAGTEKKRFYNFPLCEKHLLFFPTEFIEPTCHERFYI